MKTEISIYALKFLKYAVPALITFLMPIKGFVLLIILAITFDTIFAIYATIKLNGWKSFRSHLMSTNFIVKILGYGGTTLLVYLIDLYIVGASGLFNIPLIGTKLITLFWVIVEAKSMDETSQDLGNPPFYVMIKTILGRLKSLKKDLNELKKDE